MSLPSGSKRTGTKLNILTRITSSDLRSIRVAVRRTNIAPPDTDVPTTIERGIEEPKLIIPVVHHRRDGQKKFRALFDRDYIVVNEGDESILDELEESQTTRSYSRSRSRSRRSRSRSSTPRDSEKEKNRSLDRRHSAGRRNERRTSAEKSSDRNRSGSKERHRSSERIPNRSHDRGIERPRLDRNYRNKRHSIEREHGPRKRSLTPLRPGEYRPSAREIREARERGYNKDRRSRSLSRDRFRTSTILRKSISPNYRPGPSRKSSRSPRRSLSRDRENKSRYSERRKSRSPYDSSKRYFGERKRSSEKHRSRSPPRYEDRRRSRSPINSPSKYDSHSRKRSRSPGYYKRTSLDRRRSPYQRRRPDYRRSRTPTEKDRKYRQEKERRRSRSRSPHRTKEPREVEFTFYEGIPGAEYWIPGGPIRPALPAIPRFYPPFYPRGIGMPMVFPPRMPIPYPRPRLPIYNSKKVKPSTQTSSTITENPQNAIGNLEANAASTSEEKSVVIEEVTDNRTENVETTGRDNSKEKNIDQQNKDKH